MESGDNRAFQTDPGPISISFSGSYYYSTTLYFFLPFPPCLHCPIVDIAHIPLAELLYDCLVMCVSQLGASCTNIIRIPKHQSQYTSQVSSSSPSDAPSLLSLAPHHLLRLAATSCLKSAPAYLTRSILASLLLHSRAPPSDLNYRY
jgi:hypothetical protein